MTTPSDTPSDGHPDSPTRLRFLQHLTARSIKPAVRGYYVRWAEDWIKAGGDRGAAATTEFFAALGRVTHLFDWQYRQAVSAVRILACEILNLPWAVAYDWRGLADQARSLEHDNRIQGRESLRAGTESPAAPIGPSGSLPETNAEIARIAGLLRPAVRLAGLACTTEKTYLHWVVCFTRFCLMELKQTPQGAGPPAITAYLDYLALERNISLSTRKQALNALVFLTKKVFGIEEFTIRTPTHGHVCRRPPVVLSRREITAVLAHLEDPWKLAAELMYGSGLRLMECLRLRVKDLDFDQGSITIPSGNSGRHRVVPLPRALEGRLTGHLAAAREKHRQNLAAGAGEVHMPEAQCINDPNAPTEWPWQYVFASATLSSHPRTGRVARPHLHEFSMQRRFKNAVTKAALAKCATCHTLRNSFACHLLASGTDICTVKDLLGHTSVATTMIYLHPRKRPGATGVSPLDLP